MSPAWFSVRKALLGYRGRRITPRPLSFEINQEGITILLGKNGAGKSTLLRAVLGDAVFFSGEVRLFGEPVSKFDRLAYVPQEPAYPGHLRLEDSLALGFLREMGWFGPMTEAQQGQRERVIASFGLGPVRGRPLAALSPGERQRAFLARAFLQSPRVLLLDEPTNHLDPEARHFFWEALRKMVKEDHCCVLLSTHDLGFAKSRADWICALNAGCIVYNGEPGSFFSTENLGRAFGLEGELALF